MAAGSAEFGSDDDEEDDCSGSVEEMGDGDDGRPDVGKATSWTLEHVQPSGVRVSSRRT